MFQEKRENFPKNLGAIHEMPPSSIISRAAHFYGTRPLWQKISGIVCCLTTSIVIAPANVGSFLTIGSVCALAYTFGDYFRDRFERDQQYEMKNLIQGTQMLAKYYESELHSLSQYPKMITSLGGAAAEVGDPSFLSPEAGQGGRRFSNPEVAMTATRRLNHNIHSAAMPSSSPHDELPSCSLK